MVNTDDEILLKLMNIFPFDGKKENGSIGSKDSCPYQRSRDTITFWMVLIILP